MIFVHRRWKQFTRGLWSSPAAILATVSGVISIIVPLATIVQWLLAQWTSGA